jgi:single-strand DNA-binding protein
MSKDINQCNFIGRLTREVEVKHLPNGSVVCNFSIACSDDYKNKQSGEMVSKTNWIPIVAFNRLGEICGEYLKKGSQIYISGKFTTRKWQDQEGKDRYATEIVASEMQMLGGRSQESNNHNPDIPAPADRSDPGHNPSAPPATAPDDFPGDIPF